MTGRRRRALWTATVALAGAVACTDVSSDPKLAVAIEIEPPALPSLIVGDSLRDSLGIARPVVARIFNAKDALITGGAVTFLAIDTGRVITLDPRSGFVSGNKIGGPTFVVATAGALQSVRDTFFVTPRPTLFSTDNPLRDSLQLRLGGDTIKTVSVLLQADTGRVAGATPLAPVSRYVIGFAIVYPAGLSNSDTTRVYLANPDNRRPSMLDTTASGVAARGIRLSPRTQNLSQLDSVVIEVSAFRPDPTPARRVPVPGSPIRFSIKIKQPVL